MCAQIREENFKEIYRNTYQTTLKFIIIKCHNIEDINDIIQDTYLELLLLIKRKKILEIEHINQYLLPLQCCHKNNESLLAQESAPSHSPPKYARTTSA